MDKQERTEDKYRQNVRISKVKYLYTIQTEDYTEQGGQRKMECQRSQGTVQLEKQKGWRESNDSPFVSLEKIKTQPNVTASHIDKGRGIFERSDNVLDTVLSDLRTVTHY